MHKALHPRDDIDRLYMSSKEGERELLGIQNSIDTSIQRLKDYIKQAKRKTGYSDQKQYWQHKHQQNKNYQKTKMGRKITTWTFQATNQQKLTRENLDIVNKGKP